MMNKDELITFRISEDKENFEGITVEEVSNVISQGKVKFPF